MASKLIPPLWCGVSCCAVLCRAPCCGVLCCAVLCCGVLCCAVLRCAVLCCAVLRRAVLWCAVLCRAVLCCAVLCCAVLCCVTGRGSKVVRSICGSIVAPKLAIQEKRTSAPRPSLKGPVGREARCSCRVLCVVLVPSCRCNELALPAQASRGLSDARLVTPASSGSRAGGLFYRDEAT